MILCKLFGHKEYIYRTYPLDDYYEFKGTVKCIKCKRCGKELYTIAE